MRNLIVRNLTATALLIAMGILIPLIMPIKFVLEPASYTLASHVPVFMAMFISPIAAIAVALGTTLGFFVAGFPITVVMRAASHVIFAGLGALYLTHHQSVTASPLRRRVFSLVIGVVHALCEVVVASIFYFGGTAGADYLYLVVVLVGVGGFIHSLVDFELAWFLTRVLCHQRSVRTLFVNIALPNKAA